MTSIAVNRDTNVPDAEAMLAGALAQPLIVGPDEVGLEIMLPSQSGPILADTWHAVLTGSLGAHGHTRVVARGFTELDADTQLFATPAGLTALSSAYEIVPEGAKERRLDLVNTTARLASRERGLVATRGGGQILFETDPDFPVAGVLRASASSANESSERRRMFAQLVLDLRKRVEIGALRRRVDPVSEGPAGAVGRFLFELHENGLEHGSRERDGRSIPATRMLRIRKHVANRPEDLIARHGGFPGLAGYLEGLGSTALVEATISDFGNGVVDGFLASPVGEGHVGRDRRELLDSLLFERLSAKGTDPAAGLGIQRALRAAAQMQAFVSLRTAEFWLTGSYADGVRATRMRDVVDGDVRAKVRGTHWQILWPQP